VDAGVVGLLAAGFVAYLQWSTNSYLWWASSAFVSVVLVLSVYILLRTPFELVVREDRLIARCVGANWEVAFRDVSRIVRRPRVEIPFAPDATCYFVLSTKENGRRIVVGPVRDEGGKFVDLIVRLGF